MASVRMEGTEIADKPRQQVDTTKTTMKAKEERKVFNEERAKGEEFMSVQKKPFCGACMWLDYMQAMKLNEFQKTQGIPNPTPVMIPNWQDYAGEDKFVSLGKPVERINRKEGVSSVEHNFECKKNTTHHVCLMESKAWHADFGILK